MSTKPVKVAIAYCAECGYEPQTLSLARALMETFGYKLSAIELIPWHDGAFDVTVGGELVHSMLEHGGFPGARQSDSRRAEVAGSDADVSVRGTIPAPTAANHRPEALGNRAAR
jgi:selenoprotein W-related protein